eukprot:TRINITY_DN11860_c0_g1_i1.p1 TRINITY_DN11860_c0_g1~~TRINITY_DN11860_c0_g1_i1.p1  ORF type:complete len:537 (+),score=125.23 TRINITY_DN11860_c0_g1_i1:93-1613(+)
MGGKRAAQSGGPRAKRAAGDSLDFTGWTLRAEGTVDINFRCGGRRFRYSLALPGLTQESLGRPGVGACLAGIGLALAPWLWQATRPRRLVVSAVHLDEGQLEFWGELYCHALGEWLWENGEGALRQGRSTIPDPSKLLHLEVSQGAPKLAVASAAAESGAPRVLLPFGGGKDSLALHDRLGEAGVDPDLLFIADRKGEYSRNWRVPAAIRAAKGGAECADRLVLAELVFADQQKWEDTITEGKRPAGFLWAAVVCFTSALVSVLRGHTAICVGNERSASCGNGVWWGDTELNHQFDKGMRFEKAAHRYLQAHVRPDLWYFSGLADLWDIQIAKLFCRTPRYLPVFYSCNAGEAGVWCASCPKCCYVYLLLSAFAPVSSFSDTARRTPGGAPGDLPFAGQLLDAERLYGVFDQLAAWPPRPQSVKPMDCVGTAEESRLALHLARERLQRGGGGGEALPGYFRHSPEAADAGAAHLAMLADSSTDTNFPPWFAPAAVVRGPETPPCAP